MALSGSVKTNSYSGRYYTLSWTATQSIPNNQSTINWTLSAGGLGTGWIAERYLEVTLDGQRIAYKEDRVSRYDGVITTGSLSLKHNSSGNKSFSVNIQVAVYGSTVNCIGSDSFTLNPIPRAASLVSAPNFTDEENPTITYSNPAGNNVTSLQACITFSNTTPDIAYRDISKTGDSYTFNFTDEERAKLWSRVTSGNSNTVIFKIKTVIGEVSYYSQLTKTLTLTNYRPTATGTAVDTGVNSTALTGNPNKIIKGFNWIKYTIDAEAAKGATIKEVYCINGDTTYNGETGTIRNAEAGLVRFKAKDSRGNTNLSGATQLEVIDYIPLTCNLEAEISLNAADGTKVDIDYVISGNFFNDTFGKVRNSLSLAYTLEYGSGGTSYSTIEIPESAITGNTYRVTGKITNLDYKESYTVIAEATDKVVEAKEAPVKSTSKVLQAIPVFDWGANDFNFNVPIAIQGEPVADFIVESYKDGFWYCEKWNSGKSVCYGKQNMGAVDCKSAWGSWFISSTLTMNLPSELFIENPQYVDIRVLYGAGDGYIQTGATPPTKDKLTFNVARATSHTFSGLTPGFYVVGRWK